jgi:4-alpha-glucanotransferase
MRKFWQFLFRKQWVELKNYCRERSIKIMGDIPIFVAHDSAEVWAKPELFDLDDEGEPRHVAGVPPDYFSETGQLWGNPLYRWDRMGQDGYSWWIERFRSALDLYDLIRLDHFRGFEAYWSVPADETTAVNGEWVQGPGSKFFRRIEETFGKLPIVAENLGWITPEVEALRKEFGYPGMAILQFAFGTDPQLSEFIPHNVTRNTVYYTGTHDNDTVAGWWKSLGTDDSTRTSEQAFRERELARRYLATNGSQIHWDFIRAVFSSTAKLAVVPLQDLLGLGSDARMNLPGTTSGNWLWRFSAERLNEQIRHRVKDQLFLYGRLNRQIDPPVTDP